MDIGIEILEKLKTNNSYKYIEKLQKEEKLFAFLPEMLDMKKVGECKYHVINCFDHSIYALKTLEQIIYDEEFLPSHIKSRVNESLNKEVDNGIKKIQLLKLGILFHDIGKPPAKTIDKDGRVRFRDHEKIGAKMVLDILPRFNLSKNAIDIVYKYVRYHMELLSMYKNNDMSKKVLFDVFDKVDEESIELFILGYADIVSTRKLLNPNEDMGVIKTYMEYAITNYIYKH